MQRSDGWKVKLDKSRATRWVISNWNNLPRLVMDSLSPMILKLRFNVFLNDVATFIKH